MNNLKLKGAGKLSLNRETIRVLSNKEASHVGGGEGTITITIDISMNYCFTPLTCWSCNPSDTCANCEPLPPSAGSNT